MFYVMTLAKEHTSNGRTVSRSVTVSDETGVKGLSPKDIYEGVFQRAKNRWTTVHPSDMRGRFIVVFYHTDSTEKY